MQPLKLVIGYMPKVDRLPSEPRKLGLTHRLAFVLDTYRQGCVDDFFDAALYEGLVGVVRKVVGADSSRAVLSRREAHHVASVEEFHRLLQKIPEAEREPFPRVVFLGGSSVVAILESEPWAHIGGPDPYHDSFTLAVFTASDLSDVLVEETRSFCEAAGSEITEIIQAEPVPVRRGISDAIGDAAKPWRRLFGKRGGAA